MPGENEEEKALRSAALQSAQSIFIARQRAEHALLEAKEALERKTLELARQREWFRVTLSSIGDAVITADTKGNVTFLNSVAEVLTGWPAAEAQGRPLAQIFNIVNEETRKPAQNPVERVLVEGVVVGLANHTALIARDGRETPIEDSAAPIRDGDGKITGAVMVFHDVTEQRRAERALRQSEAGLAFAMEAGQMGAWEWSIASGKVSWSPTLEVIHGLQPGAFGGGFEDFQRDMHPEDRARVLACIQESVGERKDYRVEYRIIKPDGTLSWIEARGKLLTDGQGNPERMAGVCMDITSRKQVEEALRTSEEVNRTIIESSRDCIQTLSLDGAVLWISEVARQVFGKGISGDLVGQSWMDLWKAAGGEAAAAAVQKAAGGGTGNFVGWHSVDGQPRCWDVLVSPILDPSGRPEKLLAVSRDITERRKLEEVHARLAAVVEFSDDAIITKTLEGIITTWNRGAERTFGYAAQEVIGKPVTILIPPEHLDEEPWILERVRKGKTVLPYETLRMKKDGTRFDVSLAVSPIKDAGGAIIGVSKIARDISGRKQAEAERARLTSLLEKSLNDIYIFDTRDLRFQYVNQGALRNLGYAMHEMRDMTPLHLKTEFNEAEFRQLVRPLLSGEKENLIFQTTHRRSDGSLYPVEVHLQCVTHAGEPVFMEVVLDITERRKVEEDRERLLALEQAARAKAQEAENRARFLAEASGSLAATLDYEVTLGNIARAAVPGIADWCAVHMLDHQGAIRVVAVAHVNPAKLALAEELRERYPEQPGSPSGLSAVLRSGQPQVFPFITDEMLAATARDPGHLSLLREFGFQSVMIVPLVTNGRTLGAITLAGAESGRRFSEADLPFAADLAARAATAAENARLYQELHHANAAKDHFMAVLSHELRTPLNPVLMTVADLERDETIDPVVREQLAVVHRNVELEARLIDDLLDSTRIASGKLQLHRTVVDATELLLRAVAIVEGDARTRGVRLEVTPFLLPCPVHADPARLQQVIWNVAKNAVKFTPEDGRVRFSSEVVSPEKVRIVVQDNGIGIEPEHLGKIFNAFEQGDTRTGLRFGGLGLGLAISKALVTLHGGSLVAQSGGRGLGATFIIELPLAAQPPVTTISGPAPAAPRRALRLLVVEDHETTSDVMVRLLTRRGYSVHAASSLREAVSVLEEKEVDVLVSDVGLPDGSGRELMEMVRRTRRLPGIALSGYGTEADLVKSKAAGFDLHLTKPVDIDRLDQEIQRLCSEDGPAGAG